MRVLKENTEQGAVEFTELADSWSGAKDALAVCFYIKHRLYEFTMVGIGE